MKKHILIIKHGLSDCSLLKQTLLNDYIISETNNDTDAFTIINNHNIDLVLLDIDIPIKDRYSFLEELKKYPKLNSLPVIVVTESNKLESKLRALKFGAWDYISKPFNHHILLFRIKNAIDRSKVASFEYMKYIVEHDEMTDIYNRNKFISLTKGMILSKPPKSYIISSLDIDNFKIYNDLHGYDEGNKLLQLGASILKNIVYSVGGICCRDYADHFYDIVPNSPEVLEKLYNCFEEVQSIYFIPHNVTVSIGHYIVNDTNLPIHIMMDKASMARLSIKHKSENRVAFFNEFLWDKLLLEQELMSQMQTALDDGQFEVFFQPMYNYGEKSLVGTEALVRWRHPTKGLLPPGIFIPLFEKNGFISKLDRYIWEEACKYMRRWLDNNDKFLPISVSVNISRVDIRDNKDIVKTLSKLIEKYNLPHSMLRLEVTESAYMENPEYIISIVEKLKNIGFTVEMDDFGSGYSSLNTLKDIPVDIIKLDLKFLSETKNTGRSGNILQSIFRMARWLDTPIIAEGVETYEQAEYLSSIGCIYMQGYYFSKPLSAENFENLLINCKSIPICKSNLESPLIDFNSFWDPNTQAALLFNSYVGGAAIIEYDGTNPEILRFNDRGYDELGVKRESYEKYKINLLNRFFPEDRYLYIDMLDRAIETGIEAECTIRSKGFDNSEKIIWLRHKVRKLAYSGNIYIFYAFFENITEQIEAKKHIETMSDELTNIIKTVPVGIGIYDIGKEIIPRFLSPIACNIWGFTAEEYKERIEQGMAVNFMPNPEFIKEKMHESMKNDIPVEAIFPARKKDGENIWVNYRARFVQESNGKIVCYTTIVDVTEEHQSEQLCV